MMTMITIIFHRINKINVVFVKRLDHHICIFPYMGFNCIMSLKVINKKIKR